MSLKTLRDVYSINIKPNKEQEIFKIFTRTLKERNCYGRYCIKLIREHKEFHKKWMKNNPLEEPMVFVNEAHITSLIMNAFDFTSYNNTDRRWTKLNNLITKLVIKFIELKEMKRKNKGEEKAINLYR